jgi:hypothetical protein
MTEDASYRRSEEDLRQKLVRDQEYRGAGREWRAHETNEKCFRCGEEGHHRSQCPNPPLCYNCQTKGHMAPNCPYKNSRGLKLCAYGIPGQLFYSLHVPIEEEDEIKSPITAVMTILEGKGSVAKVTTELKYLIRSDWDWQVKKVAQNEYMFVVPSARDLDSLTKIKEFKCKISDMLVMVEKSDFMVGCTDVLSQVWVLVWGFPPWARKEKAVEEVAYLVGDLVEVDSKSLPGLGPIRLKVACKDPAAIKGSSKVYFNGRGFFISWNLETEKNERKIFTEDKPGKENEDEDSWEEEEDDEISDNFPFGDQSKQGEQKSTKEIPESSKQGGQRGGKQQSTEVKAQDNEEKVIEKESGNSKGSEGTGEDDVKLLIPISFDDAETQQELLEEYMKSNITVPEATVPSLTQQETNLEEVLTVVADPKATNTHAQEDDQGFITVSSAKKQKLRHVEVAQKTCARVTGTGTPIPIRAERRARMLDSQGTSQNSFAILQNISSHVLNKVALDCGIILGDSDEEVDASIDLIKAKELAQATLAEAENKKEQAQKDKQVLVEEEEEEVFNEEHSRIIQDLEEVSDDIISGEVIKGIRDREHKGKKVVPNECSILEC